MKKEDLELMKEVPGVHLVGNRLVPGQTVVVASINGKLYAMVADQELKDDGWHQEAYHSRTLVTCLVAKVGG